MSGCRDLAVFRELPQTSRNFFSMPGPLHTQPSSSPRLAFDGRSFVRIEAGRRIVIELARYETAVLWRVLREPVVKVVFVCCCEGPRSSLVINVNETGEYFPEIVFKDDVRLPLPKSSSWHWKTAIV